MSTSTEVAAALERLKAKVELQRTKLEVANAENGELRLANKKLAGVADDLEQVKGALNEALAERDVALQAEHKARADLAVAQADLGAANERLEAFEAEAVARERVANLVASS
jgi:hypothetical protein